MFHLLAITDNAAAHMNIAVPLFLEIIVGSVPAVGLRDTTEVCREVTIWILGPVCR